MCRFDKENPWGIVFHVTSQSSRFDVPRLATRRPEKYAAGGIRLSLLYRAQEFTVAVVRRRKNKRQTGNPANSQ
jgi:hypothetical protein